MRIPALLVMVLSLTGCCDYDRSANRRDIRREMRQSREDFRDAQRELRRDALEAHRELRQAMRDFRESFQP